MSVEERERMSQRELFEQLMWQCHNEALKVAYDALAVLQRYKGKTSLFYEIQLIQRSLNN
jgi:DNA helicase TIP49 (TBP-interacting protein)